MCKRQLPLPAYGSFGVAGDSRNLYERGAHVNAPRVHHACVRACVRSCAFAATGSRRTCLQNGNFAKMIMRYAKIRRRTGQRDGWEGGKRSPILCLFFVSRCGLIAN